MAFGRCWGCTIAPVNTGNIEVDPRLVLIDKGADDSLRNAAGLTPYEGTRLHGDSPAEERVGHFRVRR